MPNPENLKSYKPGQSGNPSGKPPGTKNRNTIIREILSMSAVLPKKQLEALQKLYPGIANNMTVAEIMTIVQAHKAITKSDTYAFKTIMDYAPEAFENDPNFDKNEIKITVEYVKPGDTNVKSINKRKK